jgi:hypothetical protein
MTKTTGSGLTLEDEAAVRKALCNARNLVFKTCNFATSALQVIRGLQEARLLPPDVAESVALLDVVLERWVRAEGVSEALSRARTFAPCRSDDLDPD